MYIKLNIFVNLYYSCQQNIFKNICVSLVNVFSIDRSNEMKHCNKDMCSIYFWYNIFACAL